MTSEQQLRRRIKWLTSFFIVGLLFSGITAIPLKWEVELMVQWFGLADQTSASAPSELGRWLLLIHEALQDTSVRHPMLFYGTDWLAFGHIVIAVAFLGALRDPVQNRWLFDFGLIACAMVIPFALVFGSIRGVPVWWRLIDCSFGVFGAIPLWLSRQWVAQLKPEPPQEQRR
jgi:hypothetical protein